MQNADGAVVSFREPLGQTKVMQIRQGETMNHQGAITHGLCCLAAQYKVPAWKEGWVIKVSNLSLSKILNKDQNSIFYEFHKKNSFP